MSLIVHILTANILPIFLLIGLGFVLEKSFTLQMNTLTKLNFYIFVPSFMFVNLYETPISLDAVKALLVSLLMLGFLFALATVLGRIRGYEKSRLYTFQNAIMFYNSGNIGIPLITLVYSTGAHLVNGAAPLLALALSFQVMVHVVQSIGINTLGFINAGRAHTNIKSALLRVFKMPTVYMVPLAFLCKKLPLDVTALPIWPVLNYARNALVPIALLSLGVQLAKSRFRFDNREVYVAVFTRLFLGPALALAFIYLLGLDGLVAQVLLISASVPTAVNTALIAVEENNHPTFATQIVVLSTLLSALTMTGTIYLSGLLFPL